MEGDLSVVEIEVEIGKREHRAVGQKLAEDREGASE